MIDAEDKFNFCLKFYSLLLHRVYKYCTDFEMREMHLSDIQDFLFWIPITFFCFVENKIEIFLEHPRLKLLLSNQNAKNWSLFCCQTAFKIICLNLENQWNKCYYNFALKSLSIEKLLG